MVPLVRESFRERFNVAVSREKDQLWLFHSVGQDDLHPDCMRRRLLEYCYNPTSEVLAQDLSVCKSEFERDVAHELIHRDFRVIPAYPCAGKTIDLVVEGTTARLAVECDGDRWHGPDRYEADMVRQRILERCGWRFVRVRGSAFYGSRQKEISRIVDAIQRQGIEPAGTKNDCADRSWISAVSGRDCLESLGRGEASNVDECSAPVVLQDRAPVTQIPRLRRTARRNELSHQSRQLRNPARSRMKRIIRRRTARRWGRRSLRLSRATKSARAPSPPLHHPRL